VFWTSFLLSVTEYSHFARPPGFQKLQDLPAQQNIQDGKTAEKNRQNAGRSSGRERVELECNGVLAFITLKLFSNEN
jgi:hypothetical protein